MQFVQPLPQYLRNVSRSTDGYKLMINPHRDDTTIQGKFKTIYGDRAAIESVMNRAVQELHLSDDWRYSRIDFAIDFDCPYTDTDKITRLFLLLLSESERLGNRYTTKDPYSGTPKTTRIGNDRHNTVTQIEHYNRALVDQSAYDIRVINRLEFRLGGLALTNLNACQNMRPAVEAWLNILDKAITPETLAKVEYQTARALFDEWQAVKASGSMKQIAQYIRAHSDCIYTRNQLKHLFMLESSDSDKAEKAAKNLWSNNKALRSELYTLTDLEEYRDTIWNAAQGYLNGQKAP